jgi:hypothetical protein
MAPTRSMPSLGSTFAAQIKLCVLSIITSVEEKRGGTCEGNGQTQMGYGLNPLIGQGGAGNVASSIP